MPSGYDVLKSMIGLHEVRDNKKIRDFLKKHSIKNDLNYDPATTAWCALIANAAERAAGNPGNGKALARSFLTYGTPIFDRAKKIGKLTDGKKGDIVIFERGGSTWQGHIAYLDGYERGRDSNILIRTIGGNQSDSVSVGWYPSHRLLGIRRI
jgi:uncharacterized protein (TIGR02594 family)